MPNPPHPGLVLADTVLHADGGISVAEFAKQLGVPRVTLSRVVNARAAISIDLALRLAHALGGSGQQLTGGGSRGGAERVPACAGYRG